MTRPTVLVVDTQEPRRKEVVKGVAATQYEVVVAASAHEGQQYVEALHPDIVIGEAGLPGLTDPEALARGADEDGAGLFRP